ncbi:hypothetical protein C5167_020580, partial [Papaver somniferum]
MERRWFTGINQLLQGVWILGCKFKISISHEGNLQASMILCKSEIDVKLHRGVDKSELCIFKCRKSSNLCYTATGVFAKRGVLMEHTRIQERLCGIAGVSGSWLSKENRIGVMVHSGRPEVITRCQKKEESFTSGFQQVLIMLHENILPPFHFTCF